MRKIRSYFVVLLTIIWLVYPAAMVAQSTDKPIVQAIFFFSPTCPHCHDVINEVLLPMIEAQGESLQIMGIDTTKPDGAQFYQAAIERYQIPSQRRGVPTLIIGEVVLVGSLEIPEQFPGLVEKARADGGIGWPDIPGLERTVPPETKHPPSPSPNPAVTATPLPTTTPKSKQSATSTATPTLAAVITLGQSNLPATENEVAPPDAIGFTLAGVIMFGMVLALGYAAYHLTARLKDLLRFKRAQITYATSWAIPILALFGLSIAIYLAYVEMTHVEAICGPIGECNVVQASIYAQILGIPIAVLGILNYLAMGALWAGQQLSNRRLTNLSALGLLGLAIFGTLFSIYLTLLELFVIQAVCIWCLSSAVITTLLMLFIVVPLATGRVVLARAK